MTQFVSVEEVSARVIQAIGLPDPDGFVGPPIPLPEPHDGLVYYYWQGHVDPNNPPTSTSLLMWRGRPAWEEMAPIGVLRQRKAEAISLACRAQIENGFICSALGAPYLYPAKAQDQANLVASVTDSLLAADDPDWSTPFWCADDQGVWDFRMHTREQIRQVGRQGKASILAAMQKNEILQRQIATASEDQLQSIVW